MRRLLPFLWIGVLAVLILVPALAPDTMRAVLASIFPDQKSLLYTRADPLVLLAEHMSLVGLSSLLAVGVGMGAAVFLTRSRGRVFLPLGENLAALAQTLPPAAVLALAVPLLGLGFWPTVLALFLYGTLPIFRGFLVGLRSVPRDALEAATGMGMKESQRLWRVELPLARPFLLAGIRSSVVVNVGTAAIGATIGAGGLGAPIVSGLVNQNPSFLLEGTYLTAALALILDAVFGLFDRPVEGVASRPS